MADVKHLLLDMLDEAFDREAWHGPNLIGTIGTLSLEQVSLVSPYEGYSAWQVALHCAYWKWETRKSLSPAQIGEFSRAPKDWPQLPDAKTAETWRKDLELLLEEHRLLREAVSALSEGQLLTVQEGNRHPHAKSIYAIASHDVYHTGMIRNMGIAGIK